MGQLLILLAIVVSWPIVAKAIWGKEITVGEFLANVAIGVVIVLIGYFVGVRYQLTDYEVYNGEVSSKRPEHVMCSHTYRCNPHTVCSGSGKHRHCSTQYDTCREHAYDVDWRVYSNIGSYVEISRVDRRGLTEPPRFTAEVIGSPFSENRSYLNYVKAAPDSLFNTAINLRALSQFNGKLPEYPNSIYDYHYINRVLVLNPKLRSKFEGWNDSLADALKYLGPVNRMNAIIVVTSEDDPRFSTALRAYWVGGKVNDVVIVIGTKDGDTATWVDVFSWSDSELFKVKLRDSIRDLTTLNKEEVMATLIKDANLYFKHKRAEDFEYLKSEIDLPAWAFISLAIFGLLSSVLVSYVFSKNNVRVSTYRKSRY